MIIDRTKSNEIMITALSNRLHCEAKRISCYSIKPHLLLTLAVVRLIKDRKSPKHIRFRVYSFHRSKWSRVRRRQTSMKTTLNGLSHMIISNQPSKRKTSRIKTQTNPNHPKYNKHITRNFKPQADPLRKMVIGKVTIPKNPGYLYILVDQ